MIFLEDASLDVSKVGHVEALKKAHDIIEKVAPDLAWSVVEEGVAALSKVEVATPRGEDKVVASKEDDQVSATGNFEG